MPLTKNKRSKGAHLYDANNGEINSLDDYIAIFKIGTTKPAGPHPFSVNLVPEDQTPIYKS